MLLAGPAAQFVGFQVGELAVETEASNAQCYVYIDTNRALGVIWEYGSGSNVQHVAAYTPLAIGQPYVVAARKGEGVLRIYLNGRCVYAGTYTQQPTGGSSAYTSIGSNSSGSGVTQTLLGPVAVWGSALTDARIRAHAIAARVG